MLNFEVLAGAFEDAGGRYRVADVARAGLFVKKPVQMVRLPTHSPVLGVLLREETHNKILNNMKKNILFSWAGALFGVALCFVLSGFSATSGAHSVQVYLDNKLMIDQYINQKTVAAKLDLDRAENHGQLIVKYSECGRTVTGRKITIKDSGDKVLKEWKFEGSSSGFQESMPCPVKDILALKPTKSNTLKLYYSSNDFPEGAQIAYLILSGAPSTASR